MRLLTIKKFLAMMSIATFIVGLTGPFALSCMELDCISPNPTYTCNADGFGGPIDQSEDCDCATSSNCDDHAELGDLALSKRTRAADDSGFVATFSPNASSFLHLYATRAIVSLRDIDVSPKRPPTFLLYASFLC